MIKLKINGKMINATGEETILEVAKANGYHIPTLCHLKLHDIGYENRPVSCRVCMVEVIENNRSRLVPSCDTKITDNMEINIDSNEAIAARRTTMELMLSNHPQDCLFCERSTNCDLQNIASELNIREIPYQGKKSNFGVDNTSKSIVKNLDKCILCRRCESICREVQTVNIYSPINRGFDTVIAPAFNSSLQDTPCTFCGQCVSVCPTAALTEITQIDQVWDALHDDTKHVVVQTAPAVRVAIGEEFNMEPGQVVTGQMVSALRRIGFDQVFDTNWGADLTIMEEANEVLKHLQKASNRPILTSCCPAWIKFIEHQFPSLIDIPSSCKSPHEMFGAVIKSYYAEKNNLDPKDIVVVSIMPCVAKKYEAARPELGVDYSDVDYVLTTREFAKMIKEAGLRLDLLEEEEFDNPLGSSTGAGSIFGTTGGVLEAALRTVSAWVEGNDETAQLDFNAVRGLAGIKEATLTIGGKQVKVAAASGLGNTRKLLEMIENEESSYDIIEIMACPSGCIAGGGQPYHHGDRSIIKKRMEGLYSIDEKKTIRRSHLNPDIIRIYDEYFEKPGSQRAHELLHTSYIQRDLVNDCE